MNSPQSPYGVQREFVLRTTRTASESFTIEAFLSRRGKMVPIHRVHADGRSFTISEVDDVLAAFNRSFMAELLITDGVQLSLDESVLDDPAPFRDAR